MNIRDVMTPNPRTVTPQDSIQNAARIMRDSDIGDAVVMDGGQVAGIVTDRDIVVRGVAEGIDAQSATVSEVCTTGIETIEPEASVDEALSRMREKDIRRLPVAKNGRPVGIISLGDLATRTHNERLSGEVLERVSEPQ